MASSTDFPDALSFRTWSAALDDLGVRVREAQQAVRRRDHAVDAAAGGAVDVGIKAVEKYVAGVQHVGLFEPHGDVAVRVRRGDVRHRQSLAVRLQLVAVLEDSLGQGGGG